MYSIYGLFGKIDQSLVIYYQPILSCVKCEVRHFEALVRLRHKHKLLLPDEFLSYIRNTKQYYVLSKTVFLSILEQLKNNKNITISMNIGKEDIENNHFIDFLLSKLDCTDKSIVKRLIFEILETPKLDMRITFLVISKIKAKGCKISIDDFGSGYANIDYLASIDFDILKIDGSIIKKLGNKKIENILSSIIDLSHKENFTTVAEHIENEYLFDTVRSLGFNYMQGFFVGKPSDFTKPFSFISNEKYLPLGKYYEYYRNRK